MPNYLAPGVYVEEMDSGSKPIEGVGTAIAGFVGLASQGPINTPTLVTNWTEFADRFGERNDGGYLAHAVYGFFHNGGGQAYIVRVGADDGDGQPALGTSASVEVGGLRIKAIEPGPEGNDITVEIAESDGDDDNVTIRVTKGDQTEEFEGPIKGRSNVVTALGRSTLVEVETLVRAADLENPPAGTVQLAGGGDEPAAAVPDVISASDYVGDVATRTGFGGLEAIPQITMVACPDVAFAYERQMIDLDQFKAVQQGMIDHCSAMGNRLAILDAPSPDLNAQQVHDWRMDQAGYDSKFAALYYPWISVLDPVTDTNISLPPSGHMAGVWSRNDDTRGVHKAPANEVVAGAVDLSYHLTSKEQELLNPDGVNCIRAFSGKGIRVWGARTLSGTDPSWRYVNVRRLFNYIEDSILGGTQWAVFEPNDQALWAKIRRSVAAFLVNEWRKGALFGATPNEAFWVKCDEETNPAESIDAGMVTCQIGIAPVKPAEFVVFQLAQFSGGTSLVAE